MTSQLPYPPARSNGNPIGAAFAGMADHIRCCKRAASRLRAHQADFGPTPAPNQSEPPHVTYVGTPAPVRKPRRGGLRELIMGSQAPVSNTQSRFYSTAVANRANHALFMWIQVPRSCRYQSTSKINALALRSRRKVQGHHWLLWTHPQNAELPAAPSRPQVKIYAHGGRRAAERASMPIFPRCLIMMDRDQAARSAHSLRPWSLRPPLDARQNLFFLPGCSPIFPPTGAARVNAARRSTPT